MVPSASMVFVYGVYTTPFVLLSTVMCIELYGLTWGRSVIKSIVTICHGPSSTSFGMRGTHVGCVMFFVFWHVAHPVTYSLMKTDIPGHQKLSETKTLIR